MLELQEHLHKPAREIRNRMKTWRGEEARRWVVMGGGSVLAARHRHRRSTDIDLWVKSELAERWASLSREELLREAQRVFCRNEEERHALRVPIGGKQFIIKGEICKMGMEEGTPFSLMVLKESGFEEVNKKREHVNRTGWEALTEKEVLYGKFVRIANKGGKLRDIYDLSAIAERNPGTMSSLVRTFTERQERRVVNGLRAMDPMMQSHNADDRAVIDVEGVERQLRPGLAEEIAKAIESKNVGLFPKEGSILLGTNKGNTNENTNVIER